MTRLHTLAALSILVGGVASAAMPATIGAMRWQRRVLLVASPTPADPNLAQQRRILDGWAKDAADRDISLVTISGTHVEGAADDAAALRKRYALKPSAFQALLIGKDGHIAMRSPEPIAAARLQTRSTPCLCVATVSADGHRTGPVSEARAIDSTRLNQITR